MYLARFIIHAATQCRRSNGDKKRYNLGELTTGCYSCPVHLLVISSSAKCLRVSKTESYGISRICFEMTRQATMPSSKA
jgi:hypothetical protein